MSDVGTTDATATPQERILVSSHQVALSLHEFEPLGPGPVSVDELLDYARRNHPRLRVKYQEIELARAQRLGAGLFTNPRLVMDEMHPLDESGHASLTTRIDFVLPRGGKRRKEMAAAAAAEQRARRELDYETDLVLMEVANAAAEVLYLQELAELQQTLSGLNANLADVQKRREERGVITAFDRLLADAAAREAEFDRMRTQTNLEVARVALAQAAGMSEPRPISIAGRLEVRPAPPVPLDAILAAARVARPEIAARRWSIREQQRRWDLARAQAIPDLTLSPRYQAEFDDPDDSMGARVAIDLPILNRNEGGISAAAAATRQARANLSLTENTTLGDIAVAYASLAPMESQIGYYEREVTPLDRKVVEAAGGDLDQRPLGDVQSIQQLAKLAKLRQSYLELRYLHHQTRARLEILLKRPLDGFSKTETLPTPPPQPRTN